MHALNFDGFVVDHVAAGCLIDANGVGAETCKISVPRRENNSERAVASSDESVLVTRVCEKASAQLPHFAYCECISEMYAAWPLCEASSTTLHCES